MAPSPPPRDRLHILIKQPAASEPYTSHVRGRSPKAPPSPRDRKAHARALRAAIEAARQQAQRQRAATGFTLPGATPGIYVQFDSHPGFTLKLESLESKAQGIELVAVQEEKTGVQHATVFVPDGSTQYFVKRFEEYSQQETKSHRPKHQDFVERITALRLATLRALWTDDARAYPGPAQSIWWEVWLRRRDGRELERLVEFATYTQLTVSPQRLEFPDRIVTLVYGTAKQLSVSLDVLDDIAELQKAKEPASLLSKLEPFEQASWVDDLQQRTTAAHPEAPAVCLLDTGVNRGHPLLAPSLATEDQHACDPSWRTSDHDGHGTEMAGLALYGHLLPLMESTSPVRLRHGLESVKLLPPHGANPPELWGARTAEAASLVEIQAPDRRRVFSMSVAAEDTRDRGKPTSWSAALDALAVGRSFDASNQGLSYLNDEPDPSRRLFLVCAGNVDTLEIDHLSRSATEPIHDPGQAWNCLTVGAFTELVQLDPNNPALNGWAPLAPHGELSPYSSTSATFESQWPVKPDIVMEGGNKACPPARNEALQVDDLSLLTTHALRPLTVAWATSAATAQAARLAAIISAEYPGLWPETVRALLVHSAEWTPRMRGRINAARTLRERLFFIRHYGFGVPSLERALRSAANSLTLIVQDTLRPFKDGAFQEMHLHTLPWPREVLEELGPAQVRLRVTLSYFIEPNPGRRGWQKRHRYASHGLRFELKGPRESVTEFRKRLNKQALEEEESRPQGERPSVGWLLGKERNKGSLHADIWEGSAADLSAREVVGIYPSTGWWKDQPKGDRSEQGARYALVISIETARTDVDVWTPVAQQVGIPTEVAAG